MRFTKSSNGIFGQKKSITEITGGVQKQHQIGLSSTENETNKAFSSNIKNTSQYQS